jgi:hypothetical protein
MSTFNVQSKLTRTLVLAPNKQGGWGTAIPDAALTRVQRFDGSAVIDFGTERRSDRGMSGKGFSFATNSQHTMQSVKLTGLKAESTDWLLPWILSNLMGKLVTTGAALPYTHVCTFDETTRTAIPTTIYLQDTADVAYRLLDMFVTSCTMTFPAKGSVSVDWDMLGTGLKTAGLLVAAPTVPAESYLMGNDAVLSFGPVGGAAVFTGRHMSSTLKIDNQGLVHEAPGGGLFGIFGRRQDPMFNFQTVIAAKEVDDVLTHYLADDKMAITLTVNSGANCQLIISIPSCNLKATKLGFDQDMPVWNIETDETTSYQNGGTPPITITVISSQPTFLVPLP